MKYWTTGLALVALALAPLAFSADDEVKSGLAPGDRVSRVDPAQSAP